MVYKKTILSSFLILTALLFGNGCKRIIAEDNKEGNQLMTEELAAISKAEIAKINTYKVSTQSVDFDGKFKINIPSEYLYEYGSKTRAEINETFSNFYFGDLNATASDKFTTVSFEDIFHGSGELVSQHLIFYPPSAPEVLSIKGYKKFIGEALNKVYFEDENSLIYKHENDDVVAVNLSYNETSKCFSSYIAEINWSKKYPLKDKLEQMVYLLHMAKNMFNTSPLKYNYSSWEDYVANKPKLEFDVFKYLFKNFGKEIKIFLENGESVTPRSEENYDMVSLYCSENNNSFQNFVNTIKATGAFISSESKYNASGILYDFNDINSYKIVDAGSCYIIEENRKDYNGNPMPKQYDVVGVLTYRGKTFYLKNANKLVQGDVNFYEKMFNYFIKNLTLDVPKK